jgi:hypothetical protein
VIVVGCPVRDRAWCLPTWFEHIEAACEAAGETPHYLFVGDPNQDVASFRAIEEGVHLHQRNMTILGLNEIYQPYKRVWNLDRFSHMVLLRNTLLERVRHMRPEHYWSVDSDILVAKDTLTSALEARDRFDAVGSRCYMTPKGTFAPSYAMLNGGGLVRPDSKGCHKVDVIMAVKLMNPDAYNVDYEVHRQGEDIGWSISARKHGVKLGWDGRTVSKHLTTEASLDKVDDRVGF